MSAGLAHLSPHLCFLFETKCLSSILNKLKYRFHYSGCFSIDRVGLSGGLYLLWKDEVNVSIRNFSIHPIDANLSWNGYMLRFTRLYGQLDSSFRYETWEQIRAEYAKPLLLDFFVIPELESNPDSYLHEEGCTGANDLGRIG